MASDDTGLGEATKNATLKAKMEEMEAEREKMRVEMEKAKKAVQCQERRHAAEKDREETRRQKRNWPFTAKAGHRKKCPKKPGEGKAKKNS